MNRFFRKLKRAIHHATAPGGWRRSETSVERGRLERMPRHVETETDLPGIKFRIPDAASFLASWDEIFEREIYNFITSTENPRILDCGANVGVSCLYFLTRFPKARVTAFEPDPIIFSYLKENMVRSGLAEIELVDKGVWDSCGTLRFRSEGSDAGRIEFTPGTGMIEISTVRLRDYLNEPVDMLKIDIEGAETTVLTDIAPYLPNIRNIFVEYHSFSGQSQTLGRVIQILTDGGFRLQVYHISAAQSPFIKVASYLGMDLQLNIFGYRDESNSGKQQYD